ncbi:MAG TPA: iron-containing alcohol dehydrogenase [Caulobacteraceae bacterium]
MLSGSHRGSVQEQVVYGRPVAEALIGLAADFGVRRLMIASTASLTGPGGLVTRLAKDVGPLCVGVFSDIAAHSPREGVIAGAAEARLLRADLLVAVGGGSVIDATKVMQLALWAGVERSEDLGPRRAGRGPDRLDTSELTPGVRMIAVPTTLSAAEFTPFAGVTDTARRVKEGYAHPLIVPRAVVLDPAMTISTPPRLWLSTGMKAVDHAVEQLCNPLRSPFADALAEAGLKGLTCGLPATRDRPADLDARLQCQIGMWLAMAGAASGRGLGASHAIGHTLGGTYGVPHGLTSCVTLPAVLGWNESVAPERQKLVAELLGRADLSASQAVKDLAQALGLPTNLAAVGIRPDQFRAIAEHTMSDRGIRSNPRPITGPDDVVEILELARG